MECITGMLHFWIPLLRAYKLKGRKEWRGGEKRGREKEEKGEKIEGVDKRKGEKRR